MQRERAAQFVRQAMALLESGRLLPAEQAAEQALALDRRNVDAMIICGTCALEREFFDDAIAWLNRALTIDRRNIRAHCVLGNALTRQGRFREALQRFERAMKLEPDNVMPVVGLAQVLDMEGKFDRVLRVLDPYVRRRALTPDMVVLRIRAMVNTGASAEAIEHVDAARSAGVPPRHERELCLLAGRAHEKLGSIDEAWTMLQAGNAIGRVPYDHQATLQRHDAIRRAFSSTGEVRSTCESAQPVFIVGLPRTGSTLLESILHAHTDAVGVGEIATMRKLMKNLPDIVGGDVQYPDGVPSLTGEQLTQLAEAYLDDLPRASRRSARIVDKALDNYLYVGLLVRMFPNGRIIDARRSPVENCFACYMQNLDPRTHRYASSLEDLGAYYQAYDALMAFWQETCSSQMMRFDYEALVDDPAAETQRLLDFVGLPWQEQCLRFHEKRRDVTTISTQQVTQPISRSAIGRTERFGARLDPLRRALGEHGE
ncbi:MAG: sulfotransferase [Phycisphaerales bacterium]|nr:sulfotransferase [Phycisphaerales bacterium]